MSDFARLTVATLRRDLAAAALGRGGGNSIRRTTAPLLAALVLATVPTLLSAHEVTHNGTVSVPAGLAVVPVIWAMIGGSAAVFLAVPTDYVLLGAGVLLATLLIGRRVHRTIAPQ